MKSPLKYIILTVIFFALGALLLYVPDVVGIADNTDFARITQPTGMVPDSNLKFFYFQRKFDYINSFDNLGDFFRFVFNPGTGYENGLKTTQFLFVKTAQLIDGVLSYLKYKKIYHFDIVTLSAVYLLLHGISATLLYKSLRTGKRAFDIIILLLLMLIFFNMGYLLYYNSLFGESAILVGFLLWFSILLRLILNEEKKYPLLVLYFICGIIFVGAKVANIPLGFLIALFSVYFIFDVKTAGKKTVVVLGICLTVAASVYLYAKIPDWMSKPNNYHSIFYGILKNSEDPEKDLQKLGIDTKYAVLADTTVYVDHKGFDIYGEEFQKEVHDIAGPLEVTFYYIKNPGRLIEKLKLSAESSVFIRPPYLGNYSKEDNYSIVRFAGRNSLWEWIRKQFTGYAFGIVIAVFLLYFADIVYQYYLFRKQKYIFSAGEILVRLMLMIFAGSQWIFPVIGNGEADLIKHMFLFNLLFDTMILLLVTDIFKLDIHNHLNRRIVLSFLGFFAVFFVLIFASSRVSVNKQIVFGKYKGSPITWEVVEETGDYFFIISKDIVDYRAFSDETNFWPESDIRSWLNDDSVNGFLYEFTEEEKSRICITDRRTIIPRNDITDGEKYGSQPLYWFCIPGYASQNYDNAYQVENAEKVFLLSIKEWETFVFKKVKGGCYWLRTPYTIGQTVRIVGDDGFVYHKMANDRKVGVVPAMIIIKEKGD